MNVTCNTADYNNNWGGHDDSEAQGGCDPADLAAHGDYNPLPVADQAHGNAQSSPHQDPVHWGLGAVVNGLLVDVPDCHQGASTRSNY